VAAIVTNVEADHLDYWGTFEAIEQGFLDFATGIRDRDGFIVICVDDLGGTRLALRAREAGVDVRTYGESLEADYRLSDARLTASGWAFDTVHNGVRLGEISLKVPGMHNALNAMAAFVTGLGLDYPATELREGLQSFSGTRRRFEFKGQVEDIRVFDDYAHHPTEIEAILRAARDVVGSGRLVVAFQAHHYYRTAMFVDEFGAALGLADEVVVLEVFAPGETPIPGASGQTMAANVPLPLGQVVFEPSWSAVAAHLVERARPGDIIMTLGAGDIGMIGLEVLDQLRSRSVLP
jgi:UDP-N-acetylmuramate--alanine ligase